MCLVEIRAATSLLNMLNKINMTVKELRVIHLFYFLVSFLDFLLLSMLKWLSCFIFVETLIHFSEVFDK